MFMGKNFPIPVSFIAYLVEKKLPSLIKLEFLRKDSDIMPRPPQTMAI